MRGCSPGLVEMMGLVAMDSFYSRSLWPGDMKSRQRQGEQPLVESMWGWSLCQLLRQKPLSFGQHQPQLMAVDSTSTWLLSPLVAIPCC